jgi:hypothetical protein
VSISLNEYGGYRSRVLAFGISMAGDLPFTARRLQLEKVSIAQLANC